MNGVALTYEWIVEAVRTLGVDMTTLTPEGFFTVPAPSYPTVRLAITTPGAIARAIERHAPDAVHIATEGPLGFLARRHCLRVGRRFTSAYHTRFPEYLAARWPAPLSWSYAVLRNFHNAAAATLVSTQAMQAELEARGFERLVLWRRGVPVRRTAESLNPPFAWPKPVFLYVGRVSIEKNIDAFLSLDLPGTKVVVGEGPARASLMRRYPDAILTGRLSGEDLATAYATADVFVFPSLTDTYGLVMLEALIAGAPVAAFPVTGPREVLGQSGCGVMDHDLRRAALAALEIPRDACRAFGARHTIEASARAFVRNVAAAVGLEAPVAAGDD